ncbi:MAG: integration host factor subunit alpha [Mariprofundaceae bacterium]|nr:integration host factor subunit alpha [Mariprofundaceae bacterium]
MFYFKEGDVTKAEIANIIYERIGLSKKESAQIVETVLNEMKQVLEAGKDVKLSGFGHFMIREKNARRGRNPKTGGDITIEPRRVVTFRASQLLKEKITEGSE